MTIDMYSDKNYGIHFSGTFSIYMYFIYQKIVANLVYIKIAR